MRIYKNIKAYCKMSYGEPESKKKKLSNRQERLFYFSHKMDLSLHAFRDTDLISFDFGDVTSVPTCFFLLSLVRGRLPCNQPCHHLKVFCNFSLRCYFFLPLSVGQDGRRKLRHRNLGSPCSLRQQTVWHTV